MQGYDVLALSPFPPRRGATISLKPVKDMACKLRVQTHVAVRGYATHLHVFEETVAVPKFSRFCPVPESKDQQMPNGKVVFLLNESVQRLFTWMKSVFIVPERGTGGIKVTSANDKIKANFVSVISSNTDSSNDVADRSFQFLYIYAGSNKSAEDGDTSSGSSGKLKVEIFTDSMDLAGDIVQDMCKFFGVEELESTAKFPL